MKGDATTPDRAAPDSPLAILREVFGYESFRGQQAAVIDEVAAGRDALVLMPTGGGKSLCYQVPAIVRERAGHGLTVVVSPLIALMEDQVAKLCERGFRAERIHSGRDRMASRQACRDYLDGNLDFLFIAPAAAWRWW